MTPSVAVGGGSPNITKAFLSGLCTLPFMGMLRFPMQGGFESVAGLLSCRKLLKDVTVRPRETAEGRDGHLPIMTIRWHCCST